MTSRGIGTSRTITTITTSGEVELHPPTGRGPRTFRPVHKDWYHGMLCHKFKAPFGHTNPPFRGLADESNELRSALLVLRTVAINSLWLMLGQRGYEYVVQVHTPGRLSPAKKLVPYRNYSVRQAGLESAPCHVAIKRTDDISEPFPSFPSPRLEKIALSTWPWNST